MCDFAGYVMNRHKSVLVSVINWLTSNNSSSLKGILVRVTAFLNSSVGLSRSAVLLLFESFMREPQWGWKCTEAVEGVDCATGELIPVKQYKKEVYQQQNAEFNFCNLQLRTVRTGKGWNLASVFNYTSKNHQILSIVSFSRQNLFDIVFLVLQECWIFFNQGLLFSQLTPGYSVTSRFANMSVCQRLIHWFWSRFTNV